MDLLKTIRKYYEEGKMSPQLHQADLLILLLSIS